MFESTKWRVPAILLLPVALLFQGVPLLSQATPGKLGIFESQTDVGSVVPPGVNGLTNWIGRCQQPLAATGPN